MKENFKKIIGLVSVLATQGPNLEAKPLEQKNSDLKDNPAAHRPYVPGIQKDTVPYHTDSIPRPDIEKVYAENKEENDSKFNVIFTLDSLPEKEQVYVKYKGVTDVNIKVNITHSEAGDSVVTERFTNLDDLSEKYPHYRQQIENQFLKYYAKHMKETVWNKILSDKEETLTKNFEKYVPSEEEVKIMKEEVEKKNSGGVTDGYDRIYTYYYEQTKEAESVYRFYMTHDGTPADIARYMASTYYVPFLKVKEK